MVLEDLSVSWYRLNILIMQQKYKKQFTMTICFRGLIVDILPNGDPQVPDRFSEPSLGLPEFMIGLPESLIGLADFPIGLPEYPIGLAESLKGLPGYLIRLAESSIGLPESLLGLPDSPT